MQAVGRVARPLPGKDRSTVVDFVDVLVDGIRRRKDKETGCVRTERYWPLKEAADQRRRLYGIGKREIAPEQAGLFR